jgi:hypothetical protein
VTVDSFFFCFIVELGFFHHPCEDALVIKCTNEKIPYFNAPLFLENKQHVGKVDEIFGPITDFVSLFGTVISCLTVQHLALNCYRVLNSSNLPSRDIFILSFFLSVRNSCNLEHFIFEYLLDFNWAELLTRKVPNKCLINIVCLMADFQFYCSITFSVV